MQPKTGAPRTIAEQCQMDWAAELVDWNIRAGLAHNNPKRKKAAAPKKVLRPTKGKR